MRINQATVIRIISSTFILGTLALSAVYVNEARKEIIFLCANFTQGVLKEKVVKQLNTGTFLHFEAIKFDNQHTIFVSSRFTLNQVSCHIRFDSQGRVVSAISTHKP
jgi:hypothetical protein